MPAAHGFAHLLRPAPRDAPLDAGAALVRAQVHALVARHRLARDVFHAMAVHRQGLEKRQQVLFRFVNIGTDLFAMAAACSRAASLTRQNPQDKGPGELADLFCREAVLRIEREFHAQRHNDDKMIYRIGRQMLEGRYRWLETGIIQ